MAKSAPYMHRSDRYNGTTLTLKHGQRIDLPCFFGRQIEI